MIPVGKRGKLYMMRIELTRLNQKPFYKKNHSCVSHPCRSGGHWLTRISHETLTCGYIDIDTAFTSLEPSGKTYDVNCLLSSTRSV